MNIIAIILASGSGSRFGGDTPKQFIEIDGKTIMERAMDKFYKIASSVYPVVHKDHIDYVKDMEYIVGGDSRQESVKLAINAIRDENPDYLLIHDAVRPMVSPTIIKNVIQQLQFYKAVDVAVDVVDTIKYKNSSNILDRSTLYSTQTPQGFHYEDINRLYQGDMPHFTDDISLFLYNKYKVDVVAGARTNIKITYPEDLIYYRGLLCSK